MCCCDAVSAAPFVASTVGDDGTAAFTPSVERRPGIAGSAGSRPMTQSWRGQPMSAIAILLDHLIGAHEQRRRHSYAERLGGLEVEHKLELDRLLHWKIAGLLAA
jgi:hypothetical protein